MELIECSETSAYYNFNQTPGKYPKEYIHLDSKHGESLNSRMILLRARYKYDNVKLVCLRVIVRQALKGFQLNSILQCLAVLVYC